MLRGSGWLASPLSPAASLCCVGAFVGIAHRAAYARSHGGPRCAVFDGKLSSKFCPQGFLQVKTEAACKSLAAIGGKSYGGSVNIATLPPGCFWLRVGGGVYLNTHSDGNANPNAQPLCAGARSHAPPHTHASCDGACRRVRRRCGLLR